MLTLSEFFVVFRDFAVSRRSWSHERYAWRGLLDLFGDLPLDAITPRQVDSWRAARRLSVSDSSVNREFNILAGALRQAVIWGYLNRSPCADLVRYRVENKRFRELTKDEARILFDVSKKQGALCHFIFVCSHDSGCRPSELRSMKWCDVDFENRSILLRTTKTGRSRFLYMTDALFAAAIALDRGGVFVVPLWPRRCLDAVIEELHDFRLYDLRKNFISRALASGCDIKSVSAAAGASPETILHHYAGTDADRVRDVFLRASLYRSSGVQLSLIHGHDS